MSTKKRLFEPLLNSTNNRFIQLPILYPEIQKAFEIHEAAFWTAKEIDYSADLNSWKTLNSNEKYFIEHILAFFAASDGIVLENLITNFCEEIKISEARNFYSFQAMIENTHGLTYSLLLDTYVKDTKKQFRLFNAIETIPCIKNKAEWALKWINKQIPFEQRIIAFAVVEGIFFSASFASIFWLKDQGKMINSLGASNELIARDEGLHTDFAVLIYKHLRNKCEQKVVEQIFREAVLIEKEFILKAIPCDLIGMNSKLMSQYIEYVADRLLTQLGFKKIYNSTNPFDFMKKTLTDVKANFFEGRPTQYKLAASNFRNSISDEEDEEWNFDEKFEF